MIYECGLQSPVESVRFHNPEEELFLHHSENFKFLIRIPPSYSVAYIGIAAVFNFVMHCIPNAEANYKKDKF